MSAERKPLARSLGEFFGHILRAVRANPGATSPGARAEVRRETTTETRDTPAGPVTLRRTTIEEVELPAPGAER